MTEENLKEYSTTLIKTPQSHKVSNIVTKSIKKLVENNLIQQNNENGEQSEIKRSNLKIKPDYITNLPIYGKNEDFISTKFKKFDEKVNEKINKISQIKADELLNISLNNYEEIDLNDNQGIPTNDLNYNNLNRIIRVRDILKGNYKNGATKEKINPKEDEEEMQKILRFQKLGPPSFLKTSFKKETMIKYKMLDGKFFGCKV